ncbi:DUF1611 domain-containing protein [Nocardioides sp. ChNu-153]|uniref:hypothetical protein n=1 Tax=Nocardioides sp. ChNu-153 TaxID=2779364 RepID=UPI00264BDF21|nr:hypothetical protein [Nocardioides sp. ChNu-153]MDN7121132.1 DUF1611 domain-containing protein [Nocardioides sp. ChNu-153]
MTTLAAPSAAADRTVRTLDPRRLRAAKLAYTTRHVAADVATSGTGYSLVSGSGVVPRAGDVVLARVTSIGKHTRLEGPGSRRQLLFPGDEVVVAYGARYAPDQFLAEVPGDLGPCHLVAAGGLAGTVVEQHAAITEATAIEPLGLLADAEGVVTLARTAPYGVDARGRLGDRPAGGPLVVAVLGTSMNSGKSTTLACLVNGLTAAGLVVSAGKATGTGAGNDAHLFRDAGATRVLDFTDFGLPSTYRLRPAEVRGLWSALVDELALDRPDVVVVELADGLYQGETSALVADPSFATEVDAVLFAAQDAMGAVAGTTVLREHGLPVAAASGVVTSSPLATGETRRALAAADVPVVGTSDLCDPAVATRLVRARAAA